MLASTRGSDDASYILKWILRLFIQNVAYVSVYNFRCAAELKARVRLECSLVQEVSEDAS